MAGRPGGGGQIAAIRRFPGAVSPQAVSRVTTPVRPSGAPFPVWLTLYKPRFKLNRRRLVCPRAPAIPGDSDAIPIVGLACYGRIRGPGASENHLAPRGGRGCRNAHRLSLPGVRAPACSARRCSARPAPPSTWSRWIWGSRGGFTAIPSSAYRRPAWPGETPYVLGQVELPDGPQVLAEVIGCDHSDLAIGMAVRLAVQPVPAANGGADKLVYKWTPAPDGADAGAPGAATAGAAE